MEEGPPGSGETPFATFTPFAEAVAEAVAGRFAGLNLPNTSRRVLGMVMFTPGSMNTFSCHVLQKISLGDQSGNDHPLSTNLRNTQKVARYQWFTTCAMLEIIGKLEEKQMSF
jgi:hypothetical protein